MTIYDYVLAQVDARKRAEMRGKPKLQRPGMISMVLCGVSIKLCPHCFKPRMNCDCMPDKQRDARRKWARAA